MSYLSDSSLAIVQAEFEPEPSKWSSSLSGFKSDEDVGKFDSDDEDDEDEGEDQFYDVPSFGVAVADHTADATEETLRVRQAAARSLLNSEWRMELPLVRHAHVCTQNVHNSLLTSTVRLQLCRSPVTVQNARCDFAVFRRTQETRAVVAGRTRCGQGHIAHLLARGFQRAALDASAHL